MKHAKMVLYGDPGTGKSVFALHFPNPFFICTDGNYEYLEDFGAKEENHIQIKSWVEFKKVLDNKELLDKYETLVIDLAEGLSEMCEEDYCKKHQINFVSELDFGKGWYESGLDYSRTIRKFLRIEDKHLIILTHASTKEEKDKKGVSHICHMPSKLIRDNVWDNIIGETKQFVRCYIKTEMVGNKTTHTRMLQLAPTAYDYTIIRGVNADSLPEEIELDANKFLEFINGGKPKSENRAQNKPIESKKEIAKVNTPMPKEEVSKELVATNKPIPTEIPKEEPKKEISVKEEPKEEKPIETQKKVNVDDKIAEIKRKLAEKKKMEENK